MISVKNLKVFNFEGAFHGMRNPLNSWDKSDSYFGIINLDYDSPDYDYVADYWIEYENQIRIKNGKPILSTENETSKLFYDALDAYSDWMRDNGVLQTDNELAEVAFLGPKDLELAQKLIKSGSDHAKFMRQISVSMDITAPIYWWKEMDTYKVGTVANSTSTMHKITSKPIEESDFSFDNKDLLVHPLTPEDLIFDDLIISIVYDCERLRELYLETKDKRYWRALIQLLPESYNQTRTWTGNYAILRNIYFARKNHKLQEWVDFCGIIENLPYGKELICLGEKNGY